MSVHSVTLVQLHIDLRPMGKVEVLCTKEACENAPTVAIPIINNYPPSPADVNET